MSACDKCMHQSECYEQRGRCASFKTLKQFKKERMKEVEMLNKKYQPAACTGSDKAEESRGSKGRRGTDEGSEKRDADQESAGRGNEV